MDLQRAAAADGAGRAAQSMSAIATTTHPGGATRRVIGRCPDVARCAHAMLTTDLSRAHLGVPEDVPLTNIHIFCNQEYYGTIANVIRRGIDDYLEANGK